MIQPPDIDTAYETLKVALNGLLEAGEALAAARLHYDNAEAQKILEGIEGKNETERRARLSTDLQVQIGDVHAAEQAMRYARYCADLAQAEVDRIRCILRLMECTRHPGDMTA